ncbi:hypothetical protein BU15DRAFT_76846 [Melanogaster broomeanus]|nr:hypothetical protein BU15DRAFT_76846 [Melanogaster broomeanus]
MLPPVPLALSIALQLPLLHRVDNHDENKVDPAAQGKRKREALGEVAKNVSKNKSTPLAPKEVKGKVPNSAGTRRPLCAVTNSTARCTMKNTATLSQMHPLAEVKEDPADHPAHDEAVDDHKLSTAPNRRTSHRRSGVTTSKVIKQEVQRADFAKRTSSHLIVKNETQDELQDHRAFKKRRTSSNIPDEAKLFKEEHEAEVGAALEARIDSEPEADPMGDEWDDLDAEDGNDPIMVTEYVNEISDYMKRIELATLPNPDYMSSQKELTWSMRGILVDWLVLTATLAHYSSYAESSLIPTANLILNYVLKPIERNTTTLSSSVHHLNLGISTT